MPFSNNLSHIVHTFIRQSSIQCYIYIFHWDIEIFEITGFSHVRNSNHLIVWWFIAVAAGSVKCGSKCNHYHILTTHSHIRENTLNIYWKKRRVRKLLIIFYCIYLAHGSLMMVLYMSMHTKSVEIMYIFIDARLKVQQWLLYDY